MIMQIYPIQLDPNHSFDIEVSGETYRFRILYNALVGWTCDMTTPGGEVIAGVRVTPYIQVYKKHGYSQFLFTSDTDPIGRYDQFNLVVLTDAELDEYQVELERALSA